MNREITKEEKVLPQDPLEFTPEFKGYTLNEIRYRRALVAVKRDLIAERLLAEKRRITSLKFLSKEKGTGKLLTKTKPIVNTILKGLSYSDYITLGITMFSSVRKVASIFSAFRRKKK